MSSEDREKKDIIRYLISFIKRFIYEKLYCLEEKIVMNTSK